MVTGTRRLPGDGGWLVAAWRADPSAEATKRLCDWLTHHREDFAFSRPALDQIVAYSVLHHADDVGVLLAVGRLVLAYDREEALRFMVRAAQLLRQREAKAPVGGDGEPRSGVRPAFAILEDPETWDVLPSDGPVG